MGARGDIEHALAKCALLELLLSNALHKLEDAGLGTFNAEQLRELLIFVIGDNVRIKFAHIIEFA